MCGVVYLSLRRNASKFIDRFDEMVKTGSDRIEYILVDIAIYPTKSLATTNVQYQREIFGWGSLHTRHDELRQKYHFWLCTTTNLHFDIFHRTDTATVYSEHSMYCISVRLHWGHSNLCLFCFFVFLLSCFRPRALFPLLNNFPAARIASAEKKKHAKLEVIFIRERSDSSIFCTTHFHKMLKWRIVFAPHDEPNACVVWDMVLVDIIRAAAGSMPSWNRKKANRLNAARECRVQLETHLVNLKCLRITMWTAYIYIVRAFIIYELRRSIWYLHSFEINPGPNCEVC